METLAGNRYYCYCKRNVIVHGKSYQFGRFYLVDEVFYTCESYYEVMSLDTTFIGYLEEQHFDLHFMFIGGALNEVDKMFNNLMDGR
jgi:hypothetical protein